MRLRKRPRQSDSGVQSGSRKLQKGAPTKTNLPNISQASKSQNSVSNSFQKYKLPTKKIEDGVCSSFKKEKLVSPTQCYNITIYNDGIVDHLKENLTPLMMFILVVAGVQLVAFCITMAFIMTEVRSGGGGIHSGQGEKHEI